MSSESLTKSAAQTPSSLRAVPIQHPEEQGKTCSCHSRSASFKACFSSFPVLLLVAVAISKAWEVFVAIIGWNVGEALISVKTSPLLCYLGFVAKELRTHGMFVRVCATETKIVLLGLAHNKCRLKP